VARDARGRGLGQSLLAGLVDAARDAGFWKLVSRVFPSNAASLAACRRVGFREVGRYESHGFGMGRWQDVVIVERMIPDNQTASGLRFRIAREDDWPTIETLLAEASLPLDGAQEHLNAFVLAVREDSVVGCATVEQAGESVVLLRSVALRASEQGAGGGRALVMRTLERAARAGATSACLLTTTAEAFFTHIGFARIDRADVPAALLQSVEFRGACPSTAVIMRRALPL
jgi:N-acetylglutamate synthase-like GNAT family acetyltransferase